VEVINLKRVLSVALISAIASSGLYAKNQVEDTYVVGEKSWSFYNEVDKKIDKEFDKKTSTGVKPRKLEEILEDLVRLNKKQLVEQVRIREILEEEYNPKPQVVTRKDGSKCIANSSSDCFVMPLTPTAKRLPVFKNWLQNPTIENSLEKKKWLSKYFNQITKGAYSDMFALKQNPQAYQTSSYDAIGYSDGFGKLTSIQDNYKKDLMIKHKDKYKLYIFLGSSEMDLYGSDVLARAVTMYPELNYEVVYKDQKSKDLFSDFANRLKIVEVFKTKSSNIGAKYFKKFNIVGTPTLAIGIKGELQVLGSGRVTSSLMVDSINQYLEFKGIIKPDDYKDYKMWSSKSNNGIAKDYLNTKYKIQIEEDKE
jgi:hypothetical protein